MTQDDRDTKIDVVKKSEDGTKHERSRKGALTKVVIRRLPPSLKESDFLEQVSPLPEYDSLYYVFADSSMSGHTFCRAYITFRGQQQILEFREKWDGYVFLDERGQEYPAVVEFAPFQKMPRKKPKKLDAKCGTLEQDPDYLSFLENMDNEEQIQLPSMEATVEELEKRDRELKANNGVPNVLTPLIEFVLQKKMDRLRLRDEKREEKRKRDQEKRKLRDGKRSKKAPFQGPKEAAIQEEEHDYEEIEVNGSEDDRGDGSNQPDNRRKRTKRGNRNPNQGNRDRPERVPDDDGQPRQRRNFPTKRNSDDSLPSLPSIPRNPRRQRFDSGGSQEINEETSRPGRRERRGRDNRSEPRELRNDKPQQAANDDRVRDRTDNPRRDRDKRNRQQRQNQERQTQRDVRKEQGGPAPTSKRYSETRPVPVQSRNSTESREGNSSEPPSHAPETVREKQPRPPRDRKLRNKDRPTMEIYKPGARARKTHENTDDHGQQ